MKRTHTWEYARRRTIYGMSRTYQRKPFQAIFSTFAAIAPITLCAAWSRLLITIIPLVFQGGVVRDQIADSAMNFLNTYANGFVEACSTLNQATSDHLALFVVVGVGYYLARSYHSPSAGAAAIVALASYFVFLPNKAILLIAENQTNYTDAQWILFAILIGLASARLYIFIQDIRIDRSKWLRKRKKSVSTQSNIWAPSLLLTASVTIICVVIVHQLLSFFCQMPFLEYINIKLMEIGAYSVTTFQKGTTFLFSNQLLNFLGINTVNLTQTYAQTTGVSPETAQEVMNTFIYTFVYMGGAGTTLGLLIATLLKAKTPVVRLRAKIALMPNIFSQNRSTMISMQIILNPIFLIPFLLIPIFLFVLSYLAIEVGLVGPIVQSVKYGTPPLLSGFLATGGDWRAVILQILNLVIATYAYMPFIQLSDKLISKQK